MARKTKNRANRDQETPLPGSEAIPAGATRRAVDAGLRPGERPSRLDDRYAAGTPGGGTELGGLAGSNFGEGDPDLEELHEAMGSGIHEYEAEEPEDEDAYAGLSGGAVGGTPANKRSSGGKGRHGLRPGGVHRGDSTIGSEPHAGGEE